MHWTDLWIQAVAPDEPHKLQRRLAWDDLTEDAFEARLTGDPGSSDDSPIDWRQALEDCTQALKASWDVPLPTGHDEQRAFVDLWWPIRCHAAECLERAVRSSIGGVGIEPPVFAQLADGLLDRLCATGDQALWKRFSAELSLGTRLKAHLVASADGTRAPAHNHYEAFVKRHRGDGLAALLTEFPVLGRHLGTIFALWLQSSLEMLERVCADRVILEKEFSVPAGEPLLAVKLGLSDPHRGGRAVVILMFAGAGAAAIRVVYKPKDMRVDAAYQALLKDLNANSGLPPLRTLAVHPRDGYGYMEHVPHRPCDDEEELDDFYNNAGRLTAILHLLGCTDCHYENLIACGDQLVLIDTETLLEPTLDDPVGAASSQPETVVPTHLHARFQQSVLRSGLMPQWTLLGNARQPVDVSALGIAPPRHAEQLSDGWLGLNSDGMLPGRVNRAAEIPTSLPVGIGRSNPFGRFLDVFTDGFRAQNHALIARRDDWLAADGALSRFGGLPRRLVVRNTRVYFGIQRQQLKPEALRSPLAQALKLEQLARSYLLAEARPPHWPVFAAEVLQMQQLDIPFFTHPIDGDALNLDGKEQNLAGLIRTSGLAAAYDRLRNLDDDEIDFQVRLIRGAVEARQLRPVAQAPLRSEPHDRPRTSESGSVQASRPVVRKIAQRLLDLAIRDPSGQVEWLGTDIEPDGRSFCFRPVGHSLYSGSIGIACLLHRLHKLSVRLADADEVSAAIMTPLHGLADQPAGDSRQRWWRDQPLGLSGCGGILLALLQLNERRMAEALLEAALPRHIESDRQLDVIGGSAGLVGALLQLRTGHACRLAILAGDRLIARQDGDGAWPVPAWHMPLLGFSHGTAGYAASLARLHGTTREPRFRIAAHRALAYERARFSKEHSNWPDYRSLGKKTDRPGFMVGWCHGAPGIAMGRACLWGTDLWDEQCAEEIAIAAETTAAMHSLASDHLCCGSLGLMVVLQALAAGPWPMDECLRTHCISVANRHRERALERAMASEIELVCFGTAEGSLTLPGFFTGLSGMGMALLEDRQSRDVVLQLISAGLWPDP